RRSACGTCTARCRDSTGCSTTQATSCAASRYTATRTCLRTLPHTAACAFRCGSRKRCTRRSRTAPLSTSTHDRGRGRTVPGTDRRRRPGVARGGQPAARARPRPEAVQGRARDCLRRPVTRGAAARRARARESRAAQRRGRACVLCRAPRADQARARRLVLLALGFLAVLDLGEVLGGDLVEEAAELVDDLLLVDLVAFHLDRRLLDHVVGGEDGRLGADGDRDRVGGARVDLELAAVVDDGDRRVEGAVAE